MKVEFIESVNEVSAGAWDALSNGNPLLSHAFLSAMELSGSVGKGTGWQPNPLIVMDEGLLLGAIPLYLKSHSYGEYVFDWAWADAYARNGLRYYPKLISAIPFTPVTGSRLLSHDIEIQRLMLSVLSDQIDQHGLSSVHMLFPDQNSAEVMLDAGWMRREGVQFRWENQGYTNFDDFLKCLSHDKRKKIVQERKKIVAAEIQCKKLRGKEITSKDWDFFYQCYTNTYHQHHSTPYLTRAFFEQIAQYMPEHILLIVAERAGQPVAAALNIYDERCLNGRYWGALEYVPSLHFELCYYQAQEFCIDQGIKYFEGGAQGEHKLARGFKPRTTCSFHKIVHPDFEVAIQSFLDQEKLHIQHYQNELEDRMPFK